MADIMEFSDEYGVTTVQTRQFSSGEAPPSGVHIAVHEVHFESARGAPEAGIDGSDERHRRVPAEL